MPRRDGTGPMGQGPLTGRGMGCCVGVERTNRGFEYGMGFGRGLGRGLGRGNRMNPRGGRGYQDFFFVPGNDSNENSPQYKDMLVEQKAMLARQLAAIERELETMNK